MSLIDRVLRTGEGKKVRRLAEIVPLINDLEPDMQALDAEGLGKKTEEFRSRLDAGESLDDLLIESFAVVREAAVRAIGQRHYDVQLMGGMALHFGWIAEMKTGEGKTLVSTLPVYLNALEGKGVHVVTVNDYLTARDSQWMGNVYSHLGISVGRVSPEITDAVAARAAYSRDVTYGTNTELGFDYLRDNMANSLEERVQRGHNFAIVDEVDSILIDEARTPLIISGPSDQSPELYYRFASIVRTLRAGRDYEVDEEKKVVLVLDEGAGRVERVLGIENLFDVSAMVYLHQLNQALRAKELFHREKDYLVRDGGIHIVDEFTGRILDGRRWSDGLHQAVEAKERVRIQEENHTWATVTLQNYFRMYEKLAGMTGTAQTEAAEFISTYHLLVAPIPTNLDVVRDDKPDLVYKAEEAKFRAVVEDIEQRFKVGQPVLVGTASVAKSELLSSLLTERGVPHSVLNAKQHTAEAQVIAQAGRLHAVTVATNMAGRGVDILLGGNPEGLALQEAVANGIDSATPEGTQYLETALERYKMMCREDGDKVREVGGLYVIGSERHESRRIDNQLRGRSGRQGDPGETRFYLSLEDELMRIFAGGGVINWVMSRAFPDDLPIEAKTVSRAIERAQGTVEGKNADIRKDVLKYDEVLDEQRKVIYERRREILQGEDLFGFTIAGIAHLGKYLAELYLPTEYGDDWRLDELLEEVGQYWTTEFTVEDLVEAASRIQIVDSLCAEAEEFYRQKCANLKAPGDGDPEEMAREIERQVLLSVVDQHWREHLIEMDYLRDGINLRAMGQQDPLVAWKQEGYDMFQSLIQRIEQDYLRYVLRVEVVHEAGPAAVGLEQASYFGATDPQDVNLLAAFSAARDGVGDSSPEVTQTGDIANLVAQENASPSTVGSEGNDKIGRNDPCYCGSGLKYKLCHGK